MTIPLATRRKDLHSIFSGRRIGRYGQLSGTRTATDQGRGAPDTAATWPSAFAGACRHGIRDGEYGTHGKARPNHTPFLSLATGLRAGPGRRQPLRTATEAVKAEAPTGEVYLNNGHAFKPGGEHGLQRTWRIRCAPRRPGADGFYKGTVARPSSRQPPGQGPPPAGRPGQYNARARWRGGMRLRGFPIVSAPHRAPAVRDLDDPQRAGRLFRLRDLGYRVRADGTTRSKRCGTRM